MPVLTPVRGLTIQREVDGIRRNLHPPIGKPFDFTDQEVKQFRSAERAAKHMPLFDEGAGEPVEEKVAKLTPEDLADNPEHSNPIANAEDAAVAEAAKNAREAEGEVKPAAPAKPGSAKPAPAALRPGGKPRPVAESEDGL